VRAVPIQEGSDVRRTSHRHDGDALGIKIPTPAHSECFDRHLIADTFDKHDTAREEGRLIRGQIHAQRVGLKPAGAGIGGFA
jgi:hypothetical protein